MEEIIGALDLFADVLQAAVLFMLRNVMRVYGHDDAREAIARQVPHVFIVPQTAIGANHRADAMLGGVSRHRAQITMNHRFTAYEQEVTDVIFDRHIDGQFRFVECDTTARAGIEFGTRKPAEIAIRVADIGDSELQIARTAMLQDLAQKLKRALFGPGHRAGKITGRRRRIRFRFRCSRRRNCGRIIHAKRHIVAWEKSAGNPFSASIPPPSSSPAAP